MATVASTGPRPRRGTGYALATLAAALLSVSLLGACGGGDSDAGDAGGDTRGSTPTSATSSSEPGSSDRYARYATVTWRDQEKTFGLAMCENPDAGTLLVSGGDDTGATVLFDVKGGEGTMHVFGKGGDTLVEAGLSSFSVGPSGELTASGTTADGTAYEVAGTCDHAPG